MPMPGTMNPACLLCGLRFGNKPLLDLASAPSRTTKEATARTTRRGRRAGRTITALRRGLRAVRYVSDELLGASGVVIRSALAPQPRPQTPVGPAGQARKARRRTAADRADREDCLICRASISF